MNQTTMERTGDTELVITRTFDAPQRLVFDAWTKPELVRRWWAPRSHDTEMIECEADLRVGGRYRYVARHPGGVFAFSGEYRELTPHTRVVCTEVFEPDAKPDGEEGAIVTITFEDRGGKTLVVSRSIYPSKEVLDAVIATGMESGMRESMDQLEELLASLG